MDNKTLTNTSSANINIALIKYWGKKDELKMIPNCSSISITLNKYYSKTTVTYLDNLDEDILYFNNELINNSDDFKKRVVRFMNQFRKLYNIKLHAIIKTENLVPTKAGFASSASGFASLAKAASRAYNLNLDDKSLSQLARLGSVSASRSIYNNIVKLTTNTKEPMGPYSFELARWESLRVIVFNTVSEKAISSREAMRLALKLNSYSLWIENTKRDLLEIEKYIKNKDFVNFGKVIQNNAIMLHRLINETGINYLTNDSLKVISLIEKIQSTIPIYYTMDAGSVVFGITESRYIDQLTKYFNNNLDDITYEILTIKNGELD